jgi:L-threonylcarbamoyladenylate synthase
MPGPDVLYLEDNPALALERALAALSLPDGVIVFPTDTVYGLLAALDADAGYRAIFTIKQRLLGQPIQVLAGSASALAQDARRALAQHPEWLARFNAGQATMVLDAGCFSALPPAIPRLQPGAVGVRVPASAPLQELLSRLPHQATWATSANPSGTAPPATADELDTARTDWLANVPLIIASRASLASSASQVVRVTDHGSELLRG